MREIHVKLPLEIENMQVVTIISDFGTKDQYVALLKGAILRQQVAVQFIDVTHQVDTHDIRQAAYFLKGFRNKFPKGTIHIVAVHNYYDKEFEIICVEHKGNYYIGPNNGVFSLAFDSIDETHIYKIIYDGYHQDLFELIAHGVGLIASGLSVTEVGVPLNTFEKRIDVHPVMNDDEIRATIIHVDKFENVVLNVNRDFFEQIRKGRQIEIFFKFKNPVTEISESYSEVPVGDVLCLFNATGFLEIAINMGKAASQLDLMKDETIQIKFS